MQRSTKTGNGAASNGPRSKSLQPKRKNKNGAATDGHLKGRVGRTRRADKPSSASHRFLSAQNPLFWHSLGIFPEALKPLGRLDGLVNEATGALSGLGIGNLRLLCEQALIPRPNDASDRALAGFLLSESDVATLVHLREFLRRRTEAVETVFQHVFRQRRITGLEARVRELSQRRPENLKPFSKLLLQFRENPEQLREIHAQSLWLSRPTSFEYAADAALPAGFVRQLEPRIPDIAAVFARAIGGRSVQFTGVQRLCEGITVYTFFREYTPVVRPDFRAEYNVHHGCGLILFGIDSSRRRILVKSGNRTVATSLAEFLRALFDVELRLRHDEVYSDYAAEDLRDRVLGHYAADAGIEIVGAKFARAGFGNHGPLTIGAPYLQPSIRPELEFLHNDSLVEIRGPADLISVTVTYDGKPIEIASKVVEGGAVRFGFDNSGWDIQRQDDFENAFLRAFGIPVNRLLHPARGSLGTLAIYAYLLGLANEDEAQPYQEDCLHALLDRGILVKRLFATRTCRNNLCSARSLPIEDATRATCSRCDGELQDWQMNRLERHAPEVSAFVASILDDADDWQLDKNPSELDRQSYYELRRRRSNGREDTLCMLLADRPTRTAKRVFERTGLPLLILQAHTDERHVYVDDDGIGRASLSYMLAAQEAADARLECKELCRVTLTRLLQNHEERVLKAARLSYDRLQDPGTVFTGDSYEVDVFNLLRSVFPYTYNLARRGKIEPDGFVCLPHYQSNSIEDVGSWNWSYDAKYSDRARGYDLNIDECRKMANYIRKLRRNRTALFGAKRKLRAHVIISNDLREEKIKHAAEFVFGPDGVGSENRAVRLLLVRQEFLIALYEGVRDNYDAIARRRAFFGDETIDLFASAPEGGYLVFSAVEATALVDRILRHSQIEENIKPESLAKSLDE